jgi:uncharacterized membrane protein YdbT with pleckstrin-like domain
MADLDPRLISGERLVFRTSKHWAGLITGSWWALLMVLASLALAWIQPDNTGGLLGFLSRTIELVRLGLFLGGCGWLVYNVIAWRTAQYSVTNLRILCHEGLLRRRSTDTLLTSVADIRTVIPALGGVLGFGHVRIVTAAGDAGRDTFAAVRDAQGFKRQVLEQKAGTAVTKPGKAAPARPGTSPDVTFEVGQLLHHLANLREAGAVSPEDYEARKAEWLRLM